MMCAGHMREAKARRKIWLNSASSPPIPSFSKSKSPVNRLVAPPPPSPSAICSPVKDRRAPPSLREKTMEVGASNCPTLQDCFGGASSLFFDFLLLSFPTLMVVRCLTVSSSLVPSKSNAMVRLGSMICSSSAVKTVVANRSVSISLGLAFGSDAFFLANKSTANSSVASAKLDPGTNGLSLTGVARLRFRNRRCSPFSATSFGETCGWDSTW
mmetsp:Transcript_12020/g.25398  ORF Transcript_12020/g.25398 Transcript_12020/m.25398 type:complete len:213 (+) Transcript_12020:2027-2665(+)